MGAVQIHLTTRYYPETRQYNPQFFEKLAALQVGQAWEVFYRRYVHPDPLVFVERLTIEPHVFLAATYYVMLRNELGHWLINGLERNIFFSECINAIFFQIQVTFKAVAKIIDAQPIFAEHI